MLKLKRGWPRCPFFYFLCLTSSLNPQYFKQNSKLFSFKNVFFYLKGCTTGCIHLTLALKPWSLSLTLCFFIHISPNPGPINNVTLASTHIHSIKSKYPTVSNYVQAYDVHAIWVYFSSQIQKVVGLESLFNLTCSTVAPSTPASKHKGFTLRG